MADKDCGWDVIHGFTSSIEFMQFCLWLTSQVDANLILKHDDSKPLNTGGVFTCIESNAKWKLIPPDEHSYGFWGPVSEIYYPWPDRLIIKSPVQFNKFFKNLKYWLEMNFLNQIKHGNDGTPLLPIKDIPESGPWPDYLEAYFTTDSRVLYKLSVELYHGLGGQWELLGPVS
jgi:hypothetical protein